MFPAYTTKELETAIVDAETIIAAILKTGGRPAPELEANLKRMRLEVSNRKSGDQNLIVTNSYSC